MFLGLDIGTSAVKAVVIDERSQLVDQSSAPLEVSRPRPLFSEQDPQDWWSATQRAVTLLDPTVRRQVRAIGLSGQMHGATLLDASGKALRPAILWNDGRSFEECKQLEAEREDLTAITGNRAMPGFTAPKLKWVAKHEPELFAQVDKVLLPKDFVRLKMTGEFATDVSDAAGTLWLDVGARRWSDSLLDACGLSSAHMPDLYEGSQVTGCLTRDTAASWGMDSVPVVAGGGDNAAGAVGVGVIGEGDAFLSLGTSGVMFVANEGYRPNPAGGVHTFCHCLPDTWHQMSVILSAASCMEWAAKLTGVANAAALFAEVELAGESARGSEIFLPYLSGERTPHNDPDAKGVLFGLTHQSDASRVGRAVLEGVAFAFRDGLDVLADAGTHVEEVSVIGGGAKSELWGKVLASALNIRMVYREGGDVGPAFGAARLAQIGSEDAAPGDIATAPPTSRIVEPDSGLAEHLERKRETFRALYQNLKPLFGDHG